MESTSIPEDFYEYSFRVIEGNNIFYELRCLISFSDVDSDSTKKVYGQIYSRHGVNHKS